jgi:hypothetical protein
VAERLEVELFVGSNVQAELFRGSNVQAEFCVRVALHGLPRRLRRGDFLSKEKGVGQKEDYQEKIME